MPLKEVEDSMKELADLRFSEGNKFLVGDALTLADLVLAVNISICIIVGQDDMATKWPNLVKGRNMILNMI